MTHEGLKPYGNVFPVFSLCENSKEERGDCHFTPAKTATAKTEKDCCWRGCGETGVLAQDRRKAKVEEL